MKSDLLNLIAYQDSYFAEHQAYAGTLAALGLFTASQDVRISLAVSDQNVKAVASHSRLPGVTCAVFIGVSAVAPATQEREPACTREPVARMPAWHLPNSC